MVAALARRFGDLDVAEEAAAEAFATAVDRWRTDGIPPNPGAWLTTTARRKAVDRLRREGVRAEKHRLALDLETAAADEPVGAVEDERLRLLFICCHPALPVESRVALTLRMVGGLTVPEIARAFLVQEPTMGQRISRAKARLRAAGVPWRVPTDEDVPARLPGVLAVLYLVFNEGYLASGGDGESVRHDLIADAIRLARLLHGLLPEDGEVAGLLALMLLAQARGATRVSPDGELIPLAEQHRGAWDHAMIAEARALIDRASSRGRSPGRYLTLAAIGAIHASVDDARDTDWSGVVERYDHLARIDPSPIVLLNRAVAVAEADGPAAAMDALQPLAGELAGYHAYFAVVADVARRLGRVDEARAAYDRAIELAGNTAEQAYLARRRSELAGDARSPAP